MHFIATSNQNKSQQHTNSPSPQHRKLEPSAAVKSKSHYPKLSLHKAPRIEAKQKTTTTLGTTVAGLTVHYFYTYFVLLVVYHRPTRMASLRSLAHSTLVRLLFPSSTKTGNQRFLWGTTQNCKQTFLYSSSAQTTHNKFAAPVFAKNPPRLLWRFAPHSLNHWTPRLLRVVFRQGCATITTA